MSLKEDSICLNTGQSEDKKEKQKLLGILKSVDQRFCNVFFLLEEVVLSLTKNTFILLEDVLLSSAGLDHIPLL